MMRLCGAESRKEWAGIWPGQDRMSTDSGQKATKGTKKGAGKAEDGHWRMADGEMDGNLESWASEWGRVERVLTRLGEALGYGRVSLGGGAIASQSQPARKLTPPNGVIMPSQRAPVTAST